MHERSIHSSPAEKRKRGGDSFSAALSGQLRSPALTRIDAVNESGQFAERLNHKISAGRQED
ncbi:hypothetical protein I380019A4_07870 [Sutterella wadsworthensis]